MAVRTGLRWLVSRLLVVMLVGMASGGAWALPVAKAPSREPVMMLSDIHFDPFHDPAKVALLRAAGADGWEAILNAPDSAAMVADQGSLGKSCKSRGVDTPWTLLVSSLQAERARMPKPLFVTVSGDLMAHQFDCKFYALTPGASAAEYSAFAAKTVAFVALELKKTFNGVPVYLALGNNDSGCKDYREDPDSAFLRAAGASVAADVAVGGVGAANMAAILREFSRFGDYNVALPMPRTRLIVLQDIFESGKYADCDGKSGDAGSGGVGALQGEWLRAQLKAARAAHERVWVMAHIPPGIDPYSTIAKGKATCAGGRPEFFLPSYLLPELFADYADVIRLVLFGHTHMDEMRVYGTAENPVPGKLVPSITPVNGNNPAFTMAEVDPATATVVDYTVTAASNQTGIAAVWTEAYRYSTTYHLPDFSGVSAQKLGAALTADKVGSTDDSVAYQKNFFVGDPAVGGNLKAAAMRIAWPAYACAIEKSDEGAYRACLCAAAP